jgi:hypothetical protein
MKIRFLLTIIPFIFLNGCCTKKYCEGFDDLHEINLYNFKATDVDSISIEIFQVSTSGSIRIDSSFTSASGNGQFKIGLQANVKQNQQFKITFSSSNFSKVYLISNFITRAEPCNKCFPKNSNDDFLMLNSYDLNGQTQYYGDLRILK